MCEKQKNHEYMRKIMMNEKLKVDKTSSDCKFFGIEGDELTDEGGMKSFLTKIRFNIGIVRRYHRNSMYYK